MRISYNKLWKILIDKNMKRKNLQDVAGISSASVAKLGKGDNITTDVLLRICEALDCTIDDILDTIKDEQSTTKEGKSVKIYDNIRRDSKR